MMHRFHYLHGVNNHLSCYMHISIVNIAMPCMDFYNFRNSYKLKFCKVHENFTAIESSEIEI